MHSLTTHSHMHTLTTHTLTCTPSPHTHTHSLIHTLTCTPHHTHTCTPSPHTLTGLPTITPNLTTISRGQSGSFVCQAVGDPPPTITWFKAANQITADTPRVVLSASRLTITNVTLEDDGYYTCRAVFPRGTTEAQAFLDVRCKCYEVLVL